jgi:hypothetical protein
MKIRFIAVVALTWACFGVSLLNAATIPAGAALRVRTVSHISSKDNEGRTFAAVLDQDVAVKGNILLKAGTKAFGRVKSSRANPRKSEPLTLELTSISVNGRNVAVKTNSVEPQGASTTQVQVRTGTSVGTTFVSPGTKIQFQLAQAITL